MAEVCCRDDFLGKRDTVILEEDEFKSASDIRVVVDHFPDRSDQFDDLFGGVIPWSFRGQ